MNIRYQDISFPGWKMDLIDQVNKIVQYYKGLGYSLTLRQVYYQFVGRDWLPEKWADKATGSTNNERSYKNLGSLINDGRMAGLISWEAIEDRTRELSARAHWNEPSEIIQGAADAYAIDKWEGQANRVEVWVEKDALEDVISRPARRYDIDYFSCRGYTSQSAMHEAAMRLQSHIHAGRRVVILHLGDHDPSGIDMTRDIEERIRLFLGHRDAEQFEVRRIALNLDQIRRYAPPPNPAKVTDPRAKTYIKAHGTKSWELDALDVQVLDQMISEHILELRDDDLFEPLANREAHERDFLTRAAENWDFVTELMEQNNI